MDRAPGHSESTSLRIITSDIHPDATTNARLLSDMGAGLVERGWRVEIVAGTPSGHRDSSEPSPPEVNGVRIRRTWNPHVGRRGVISRLINSFVLSAGIFIRLLFARRPDVLLVDTVSPFLGPAVWLLSVVRRYRYVYLATELYPDAAVALGYLKPGGLIAGLWDWMNRRVYGRASAVIVIGPRFRDKVARHLPGGANDPKLNVIHNWANTRALVPVAPGDNWFRTRHGLRDKLVILYSGNMGLSHDVESLIEAADKLRADSRIAFVFIGGGPKRPKIEQMAKDRALPNVTFMPFQPVEVLPYSLSSGDLSVVTVEAGMEGLILPSKLYPAMAAGQAILALVAAGSDVGDLVEQHGIGVRVTQRDVDGLVAVIRRLLEHPETLADMKRKSREAVVQNFDRAMAIDAYEKVLERASRK